MRFLEKELESRGAGNSLGDLSERLDQLEVKASHFRVPLFWANLLYTLRVHIAVVRKRLNKMEEGAQDTD